jgi:hypothetical protein
MGEVTGLAASLRDVGRSQGDVEHALDALRRERRFTVDATYAYARRRDIDPAWRRAADLLELSVAERRRRAFSAPPMWARVEVAIGGALIFGLANLVIQFLHYGLADPRTWMLTWMWLLYPVAWSYSVRRNPDSLKLGPADPTAIEQRLGRVLEEGRAMADDGVAVDHLASAMRRIAGGDGDALEARMAAVVLARTQRRLTASLERHRKTLMSAADQARRQQLQRLGLAEVSSQ